MGSKNIQEIKPNIPAPRQPHGKGRTTTDINTLDALGPDAKLRITGAVIIKHHGRPISWAK